MMTATKIKYINNNRTIKSIAIIIRIRISVEIMITVSQNNKNQNSINKAKNIFCLANLL